MSKQRVEPASVSTTRPAPSGRAATRGEARIRASDAISGLQRTVGNRAVGHLLDPRLRLSSPGEPGEVAAERITAEVMHDPATPRGWGARAARESVSPRHLERSRAAQLGLLAGPGRPLPAGERSFFESRLGRDVGHVRVHTGRAASDAARAMQARAFAVGSDLVFGEGEYAPATPAGRRLLAHEIAHTILPPWIQRGAERTSALHVQRQASGSTTASGISATDIFPFPQGARIVLGRILREPFLTFLTSSDPNTAAALEAIHGREARVVAATPDLFAAVVGGPVVLPAREDLPERSLRDIRLELRRSGSIFTFSLSAREGGQTEPVPLMVRGGLTASRGDGGIVLSTGTGSTRERQLAVAGNRESVDVSVFTGPILDQIDDLPGAARALAPETLEIVRLRRLPDAATDADVQRTAESITSSVRPRRQQIRLEAGFQEAGGRYSALLGLAWEMRFPIPHEVAGQFLQIPLELRVTYAPPAGVLGGIYTGANVRLPTSVPVNLSLVGGFAGGQLERPGPGGLESATAFGPAVGGGIGVELGVWRVNLRAEHLFNLAESATDANQLGLTGGFAF